MTMDRNISYYFDDPKESKNDNVSAEQSTTERISALDEARIELKQYGNFGELTQTTFSRGCNGWVGKLADGNTVYLDRAGRRVALLEPIDIVQRITNMAAKGNGYDVVRAKFYIYNDTRGGDEANGQWQNDVHILPVQVEYQIENGRVVPGMIKSGNGANPSRYENFLYEQKNVNMINLFMKTAPYLKEN